MKKYFCSNQKYYKTIDIGNFTVDNELYSVYISLCVKIPPKLRHFITNLKVFPYICISGNNKNVAINIDNYTNYHTYVGYNKYSPNRFFSKYVDRLSYQERIKLVDFLQDNKELIIKIWNSIPSKYKVKEFNTLDIINPETYIYLYETTDDILLDNIVPVPNIILNNTKYFFTVFENIQWDTNAIKCFPISVGIKSFDHKEKCYISLKDGSLIDLSNKSIYPNNTEYERFYYDNQNIELDDMCIEKLRIAITKENWETMLNSWIENIHYTTEEIFQIKSSYSYEEFINNGIFKHK